MQKLIRSATCRMHDKYDLNKASAEANESQLNVPGLSERWKIYITCAKKRGNNTERCTEPERVKMISKSTVALVNPNRKHSNTVTESPRPVCKVQC